MEAYCRSVGLPFSEQMLTWEPKAFPDWKQYSTYEYWHQGVMASTGFTKPTREHSQSDTDDLPPRLNDAAQNALPFYEKLMNVRITPITEASS